MIFDELFDNLVDATIGNELEGLLEEAKINEKRPSVTTLPFRPVPAEKAKELEQAKVGFFDKKTKKQLIASITEGRTVYAEVLALARCYKNIDWSENRMHDISKFYYKIADLNGTVLREDMPAIDDEYSIAFKYNDGDSASETGCKDVVDPAGYRHMYLLNYYLKDDMYEVLLTTEQFENLSVLIHCAGSNYHFSRDGVGYRW